MPIDIKQLNQSELSGFISGNLGATYRTVLGNNVVYTDDTNQIISGFKTFRNPPNVPYAGTTGQVPSLRYVNDRVNLASGSLDAKITLLSGQNFFEFRGDFSSGNVYNPHDAVYYYGGTYGYTGASVFNGLTGTPLSADWHPLSASGYSGYSYSGFSGYSGYSGNSTSGYSGYSGLNGGVSGTSGYSGFCGVSGYSGYSGTSGLPGGTSGYSGYSGVAIGWDAIHYVTGTDFTTSSLSLVDIDGLVSTTLLPNQRYEIEAMIWANTDNSDGWDLGIGCLDDGGSSCFVFAVSWWFYDRITATNTPTTVFLNDEDVAILKGFIVTGDGSPVISMKILKRSSGSCTCYLGSNLKIKAV